MTALGAEFRVYDPLFGAFVRRIFFRGRVVKAECLEDSNQVKHILPETGVGRILAVGAGGALRCAMLRDLIAAGAVKNGWAGAIPCGCIHDFASIADMDRRVEALPSGPKKSVRRGEGQRDYAVIFAGVRFALGDWVHANAKPTASWPLMDH